MQDGGEQVLIDGRARRKQISLIVLALAAFGLALWPDLAARRGDLLAQDNPITATPTFTGTPTVTPTPTLTLTPGATPTKVRRVVNELTAPVAGDAIARAALIWGTALIPTFSRFELHISPAGMENWQWLTTRFDVIYDDALYVLDTTKFPDGWYDLRARAINDHGEYTESFVRGVEIRNANPPTLTPTPSNFAGPISPLSPLETPTPPPTPDFTSRIPGGQGFYAPDNGAVVRGLTPVVATVNGTSANPYVRFELYWSPAGVENWNWLTVGAQQFWQQEIYAWDTTQMPDGLYDLRLRIVYRDANYSEYYLRNLSIANAGAPVLAFAPPAGILSPRSGSEIGGMVEFVGTTPANDFLRWELAWSPGGRDDWQFLVSSEQPATNSLLARLDLGQLTAGVYDFQLRVVRTDMNYTDYYVRGLRLTLP